MLNKNIDFESFSSTHHCSWFYPCKTRTVTVISNLELVQVDDNDNTVAHLHGRYADRLVKDSNEKINLTESDKKRCNEFS